MLSVVAFAAIAPRFGYAIAGFLTIVISGFATRAVKPLQVIVFACGMIVFSILLFSYALKVPMPAIDVAGFRLP